MFVEKLLGFVDIILLAEHFLDFPEILRVLPTCKLDVIKLGFLPSRYLCCSPSFEAYLGDKIGEDLVKDAFGRVETGMEISMRV